MALGGVGDVTLSNTNPNWTDMIVTLVSRDDKPATDVYLVCKTEQTHPGN